MFTFPNSKKDFIRIHQRLALVEAILAPDWEDRYFSFNANWSDEAMLASMRDGQGSEWFALIDDNGIIIAAHLPAPAHPNVLEELPLHWQGEDFMQEPAFQNVIEYGNFCAYKTDSDATWTIHSSPDTASQLDDYFFASNGDIAAYYDFAVDYYEREDLDLDSLRKIIDSPTISLLDILALDPDSDTSTLLDDLQEIGITLS